MKSCLCARGFGALLEAQGFVSLGGCNSRTWGRIGSGNAPRDLYSVQALPVLKRTAVSVADREHKQLGGISSSLVVSKVLG